MIVKKFNEYNDDGYSNDDYYTQITEQQYHLKSTKIWEGDDEPSNPDPIVYLEFTEKEVQKINSIINKREKNFVMQYDCDIDYELPTYMGGTAFTSDKKYHKYRLTIKKMRDDYYYVSIEKGLRNWGGDFRYYRCDGFEGLVKLLNSYDTENQTTGE